MRAENDAIVVRVSTQRPLSPQQPKALADIYRAAFCAPGYDETEEDVQRFMAEQLPKHVVRKGFRLAEALRGDQVVGFAYGYTGERGQWWSDQLVERLPRALTDDWVGGHFEFVELAVSPEMQGFGIGTTLHDALLDGIPQRCALLSTYGDDRPATRLYRRRGWKLLAKAWDGDSDLYGMRLPAGG